MAKRVLIIEDDADTRWMLADALGQRGYEVDTALDGTYALARLDGTPPDLVTLDLNMPILDGKGVMEKMRQHPTWARVPVLVLSGSGDAPNWVRQSNAAGYLRKPFTLDALARAVEDLAPHHPTILPRG